jgi:CMP-N-acetylneuraminic acid synthetase
MSEPMNDLIALLIIKEHSERVPDKNFRMLGGRPLFMWIVDTLLGMPIIDRVIINTDAGDRLTSMGLPKDRRLVIQGRSPALCGDPVTANALVHEQLEHYPAKRYVMTHVTSPFLEAATIERALSAYDAAVADGSGDSLFGVTRHQARFYAQDGAPIGHEPSSLLPTQALAGLYEENSAIYVFSRESFLASGSRIGEHPILFETPKEQSLDIDDACDWWLAECIAEKALDR